VKRLGCALAALAWTFSGCRAVSTPASPPAPPTYAAATASTTALPDRPPTIPPMTEPTPAFVLESGDFPPSPSPLPGSIRLPNENIVVYEPGAGSQVTSPFQVYGRAGPSWRETIQLRLIGEDGRVISERTAYLIASPGNPGRFVTEMDFEIDFVAEAARLEISTVNSATRRVDHLSGVNLILLSVGQAQVYPGSEIPERLTLLAPRGSAVIEGGRVEVSGYALTESDLPLLIQVLDRSGNVIGESQMAVHVPHTGALGTFAGPVSYQVDFAQTGYLVITETGSEIPGLAHVATYQVYLRP
jgi:hypothetical protein